MRLWVFRLSGIILIPALVLVLAEAGLRVAGYGYPSGFLLKCVAAGRSAFAENNRFTWTFFPRRIARTPVSFSFPAVKPPQTYRIFVLGESAAQGDPEPSYGFSRILGVMLEERYPGVNFEIVNTAVTAINSHVVLRIARDVAPRDGDLFIAYMGNNEVVGPYGPGTVFSPISSRLSLIRAGIALKSTRVGQLLGWLARRAEGGSAPKKWLGMEMFLGKQVRAEDPRMSKVYEYFRRNLKDIIRVAGRHGIKVIVSTVGTNLRDCAPFASMHRAGLDAAQKREWDALYHEGVGRQGAGDISGALKSYRAAARIDPQYAALDYRMGQCYEAAGDYALAKRSYVEARDYDTLRFRADSRINAIIRQVAGRSTRGPASGPASGLYLVDAARFFEEASPGGIPGDNIFYEHVHMNFHGNYLLAEV
nr:tetratricopeptide repeat protein [Nitrospiraceae bacterium]